MIVRIEIEHEGVITYRGEHPSIRGAIATLDPMMRAETARKIRLARASTPPRHLDLSDVEVTQVDGVPIPIEHESGIGNDETVPVEVW